MIMKKIKAGIFQILFLNLIVVKIFGSDLLILGRLDPDPYLSRAGVGSVEKIKLILRPRISYFFIRAYGS